MKLYLVALLLTGCSLLNTKGDAYETASAWAEAYFNCDYKTALEYVTPDSEKWLRFAASNTTEDDIQLMNSQNAEISIVDMTTAPSINTDEELCIITLNVSHYLSPTSLGEKPRQEQDGMFLVTLVKKDSKWLVRMADLPRSEKQSRD